MALAAPFPWRGLAVGLALELLAPAGRGAVAWTLAGGVGAAKSLPTPLSIEQDGFPTLELTARYDNRPFDSPPHWLLRFSALVEGDVWELQHLHHKLYLSNRPAEVERFDVTHGYNILTLGRAWPRGEFQLRIGVGLVIAHPESTVRGRRFGPEEGIFGLDQYLTGPALVAGVSRAWSLGRRAFVSAELQLSAAHARVPIQGGSASAPNIALHFLIGPGLRF